MRHLNQRFPYGYLPKVHMASEVSCSCPKGNETAVMSVSDWLEGYHEWHLGEDEEGKQAVLIWDTEKGSRIASREQSRSLFREASKILTLYYDPDTYHQICPWHHAAGDFVVNLSESIVQVKLTAARNYLPLISFPGRAGTNRVTALVAFLLNMTVQMRLDRIGGVGEPIWAQDGLVSPCLEGFFQALRTMKAEGRGDWGQESDLNAFLKSLSKEELPSLYAPLMESYREEKPEDSKVIEENLEGHIATLWKALQAFGEAGLEEES